jgi:quercetin dioxygenase-like cupin family protein
MQRGHAAMRIKAGENRVQVVEKLRGGKGSVEMRHFMDLPDFYGSGRLFSYLVLGPGCSVGQHKHETDFEAYYILHGHATYDDNGEEMLVEPGDFLLCRPGESHGMENNTDQPVEFIALILFVQEEK